MQVFGALAPVRRESMTDSAVPTNDLLLKEAPEHHIPCLFTSRSELQLLVNQKGMEISLSFSSCTSEAFTLMYIPLSGGSSEL